MSDELLDKLREEVLKTVPDPTGYMESDLTVQRFLDARDGDITEAGKMLSNHLAFRARGQYFIPEGCSKCGSVPGRHSWRQIGWDKERRPVVFFSITQTLPKTRCVSE